MIIELFGLPGAGKTSLARKLTENLGFRIIKVRNKLELLFYNLLFFIRRPIIFFRLLLWVLRNIGRRELFWLKITNAFFSDSARYQKAKLNRLSILDQGYFQNILSLFEKELEREKLLSFVKFIPKPDLLLILDLPASKIEERKETIGSSARQKIGEDYLKNRIKIMEHNYRLFIDLVSGLSVDYYILNAEKNLDELLAQAEGIIKKLTNKL